jgi:predicted peptidase
MGGFGSWMMAADYPTRIAAALPLCSLVDIEQAPRLTQVPIWAFQGGKDRAIPTDEVQELIDAIKSAGNKEVKLRIYPDRRHNVWSPTYADKSVYDWMLRHRSPERE